MHAMTRRRVRIALRWALPLGALVWFSFYLVVPIWLRKLQRTGQPVSGIVAVLSDVSGMMHVLGGAVSLLLFLLAFSSISLWWFRNEDRTAP